MDPISIYVELELATLLLAGVGALATWVHEKSKAREHRQRELHHQEMKALHQCHHEERMMTVVNVPAPAHLTKIEKTQVKKTL